MVGDGGAAEASPGHPGPECSGGQGRVDGEVQLGAGDLVVLAQGGVGGGEQAPDPGHVAVAHAAEQPARRDPQQLVARVVA